MNITDDGERQRVSNEAVGKVFGPTLRFTKPTAPTPRSSEIVKTTINRRKRTGVKLYEENFFFLARAFYFLFFFLGFLFFLWYGLILFCLLLAFVDNL